MQGMLILISVPGGILFYYFVEAETYTDKESPLTVSMAVGSSGPLQRNPVNISGNRIYVLFAKMSTEFCLHYGNGAVVVLILVKARRMILSMFLHVEIVDLAATACPP
ncbi:hypothetical protein ACFX13_002521 [Malus domestica]